MYIQGISQKGAVDNYDEFLKKLGITVLIGGALLAYGAYRFFTSPKGKTFIGGGLVATGAKIVRNNWRK